MKRRYGLKTISFLSTALLLSMWGNASASATPVQAPRKIVADKAALRATQHIIEKAATQRQKRLGTEGNQNIAPRASDKGRVHQTETLSHKLRAYRQMRAEKYGTSTVIRAASTTSTPSVKNSYVDFTQSAQDAYKKFQKSYGK